MNAKSMMACLVALLLVVVLWTAGGTAADARQEVLSNADVIELVRAGLPADLVMAKIASSLNSFSTSARSLIHLKENSVPDAVIQAMLAVSADPSLRSSVGGERAERELANIAFGAEENKEVALAWFLANPDASIAPLRAALGGTNAALRGAAAVALGRIGDADSLPTIRALLTDTTSMTRTLAAEAIASLNDRSSIAAAEQAVIRQVEPLDGYVRLVGFAKLTPAAEAVGVILSGNTDVDNRIAAAWALGEIGRAGIAGRPALEKALSGDDNPRVRREAAVALAKFRDSRAADSLQNACRIDPEVRKTILVLLADYPEAVGFLVEVMNVPPDQIAADEAGAARTGLVRLTGRDYGLDGSGWSAWLAENGGTLQSQTTGGFAPPPPQAAPPLTGLDGLPLFGASSIAAFDPPAKGEIDLEAWAIVADSAYIPTTPVSGALTATPPPFRPPAFAPSNMPGSSPFGGFAPLSSGSALTGSDSTGSAALLNPAAGGYAFSTPSHIPEVDISDAKRTPGGIRTWSSDPGRVPPAARSPEPEAGTVRTWSSDPSKIVGSALAPSSPAGFPGMGGFGDGAQDITASPPSLPQQPFAVAQPAPTPTTPAESSFASPGPAPIPPGGISLPPPPMDFGTSDYENPAPAPVVVDMSSSPATWSAVPPPAGTTELFSTPDAPVLTDGATGESTVWQAIPDSDAETLSTVTPGLTLPYADGPSSQTFMTDDPTTDASQALSEGSSAGIIPNEASSSPEVPVGDTDRMWQYLQESSTDSPPPPASDMVAGDMGSFDPAMISPPGMGEVIPAELGDSTPVFAPSALNSQYDGDQVETLIKTPLVSEDHQPFTSPYFVDPEPGQVVVGEPILPEGISGSMPTYPVDNDPPIVPTPTETTGSLMDFSGESDVFSVADESFSVPSEAVESPAPAAAYVDATPSGMSPSTSSEPIGSVRFAPLGPSPFPDSFMDPSKPLPPVKEEGLIKGSMGRDMPPTLGEGFK
ncbi:MAG: HEAT repeat domain-containing protein [Planctomycetota bacterium]|jgi:HEAT repeat protein|nr:HEAT repeat domain-containing protein [Planctomycetota bacterium]